LILADNAASASRGLIDLAMSWAVVPLGTSFLLPSGSVTLIMLVVAVCDIDFRGGLTCEGLMIRKL
jgi:hypothetical protein